MGFGFVPRVDVFTLFGVCVLSALGAFAVEIVTTRCAQYDFERIVRAVIQEVN